MARALHKAERLQEMERLYIQRAYSDSQMAERLGVDRSTVYRDRLQLEAEGGLPFVEVEKGVFKIDQSRYLSAIRLDLNEALALYLAARRISQQTRLSQPHTASALEKLAGALRQPMTDRLVTAANRILAQNSQPERIQVLETITRSWVEHIKVHITHQSLHSQRNLHYLVRPYLLEPSPWSDAAYLIGYSDVHGTVATFKIDRISDASLTTQSFTIPEEFDEQELLRYAWGIWHSEREPQKVVLRFAPGVASRRLKESIWHPTQQIVEEPDGGCLWTAEVAEWQEMLPWVRGWGADVEVLEPDELRERVSQEVGKLATVYSQEKKLKETNNQQPFYASLVDRGQEELRKNPAYAYLWAKSEKEQIPDVHLLIYHLVDVAECTHALWDLALSKYTKDMLAGYLNLDATQTGRQLSFWAALHDLGKASPGFQRKYPPAISGLEKVGFTFPGEIPNPAPHGILTSWAVKPFLIQETGMSTYDAYLLSLALGGHHGAWPTSDKFSAVNLKSADKGDATWEEARRQLFLALKETYLPVQDLQLPTKQKEKNALLTLLSGLVSLSDWIGSISEYFPFTHEILPIEEYRQRAGLQARETLLKLGWIGWKAEGNCLDFSSMFPMISSPNHVQKATIDAAKDVDLPALAILEAPTGIGKTEAALFLADTWLERQQGSGFYIAMPTQATSNQMYGRVVQFLSDRYPDARINTHLVHAGAMLQEETKTKPSGIAQDDFHSAGSINAESWFLPRKRTLLAPFGIGTVDQALMSVLQTRHFFVRMYGLGQKVVVFDEVHAYDTYMSSLFQRLLGWLHSVGTSVILLSATLPAKTRHELVSAWLNKEQVDISQPSYPQLTVAESNSVRVIPLPSPPSRTTKLEWIQPDPESVASHVAAKIADGGCAAIICNRVKRAQEIYAALKSSATVEDDNLILFHARFPFAWRKNIEDYVLSRFGKEGKRPHKAIVVATQVIEQSLDLDFDYMVSDMAPIDLLIQRLGRLHRHPKNDINRPSGLMEACLAIAKPPEEKGIPNFGSDSRVYDPATLLRTWRTLRDCDNLVLPEQTTVLIESVYGDLPKEESIEPAFLQALQDAQNRHDRNYAKEVYKAQTRMIAKPDDEGLLTNTNEGLEEDDPRIHQAFRALTRLADPSISIICLHETPTGLNLEPNGSGYTIDLTSEPTFSEVKELLKHSLNIQNWIVVDYFTNNIQPPAAWNLSAAVRYHYAVVFDQGGIFHPEGARFSLKLTRDLGLEIIREEI